VHRERLEQRLRFHHRRVLLAAVVERVDPFGDGRVVRVNQELEPLLFAEAVAERDHLAELPRRVDVKEREGEAPRRERLLRESDEHRRILPDRIEQDRLLKLGRDLAEDVDALGLELTEMSQAMA
jgi:hypothetical protein